MVGKVEAGLIQPGRHVDPITPGALTSKEVALCGALGAIEIDFPAERLVWHRVRHELQDGLFRPVFEDARIKHLPPATAVDVLASQFREFLGHAAARSRPAADVLGLRRRHCSPARGDRALGSERRAGRLRPTRRLVSKLLQIPPARGRMAARPAIKAAGSRRK